MKYDPDIDELDPFASDRAEIKRDYRSTPRPNGPELPYVCGNCGRRNNRKPSRCVACERHLERHGVERPETRWAKHYDMPKGGQ